MHPNVCVAIHRRPGHTPEYRNANQLTLRAISVDDNIVSKTEALVKSSRRDWSPDPRSDFTVYAYGMDEDGFSCEESSWEQIRELVKPKLFSPETTTSERRTEKKLQDCFSFNGEDFRVAVDQRYVHRFTSKARRRHDDALIRSELLGADAEEPPICWYPLIPVPAKYELDDDDPPVYDLDTEYDHGYESFLSEDRPVDMPA